MNVNLNKAYEARHHLNKGRNVKAANQQKRCDDAVKRLQERLRNG